MFIIGIGLVSYGVTYGLCTFLLTGELTLGQLVFCFLFALAGIILMIVGKNKSKKTDAQATVKNAAEKNYCDDCKINVSAGTDTCPICGKNLKEN